MLSRATCNVIIAITRASWYILRGGFTFYLIFTFDDHQRERSVAFFNARAQLWAFERFFLFFAKRILLFFYFLSARHIKLRFLKVKFHAQGRIYFLYYKKVGKCVRKWKMGAKNTCFKVKALLFFLILRRRVERMLVCTREKGMRRMRRESYAYIEYI